MSLPSSPEGLANARLIAAAPDLLAACKELIRIVDSDSVEPVELARCRFDDVRAALAKAEGGAA
jgi:hypothetical protein